MDADGGSVSVKQGTGDREQGTGNRGQGLGIRDSKTTAAGGLERKSWKLKARSFFAEQKR
jgi:hypothetical protein